MTCRLAAIVRLSWLVLGFPGSAAFGEPNAGTEALADDHFVREILVFADGDRTTGNLTGRTDQFLVFRSTRFGELRVPLDEAHVERLPVAMPLASTQPVEPSRLVPFAIEAVSDDESPRFPAPRRWWSSAAEFSDSVFGFLGPWKGRLGVTFSLTGNGEGRNLGADLGVSREWDTAVAKFNTNYYFSETNDVVGTDLLKGSGLLRHDFRGPFFVSYRPTLEWNRNHFVSGVEADYVLVQESVGLGVNLWDRPGRKVGLGVAENVFNLWTLADGDHSLRDTQSLFAEFDFALPWRMKIGGRGTWYYSIANGDRGWEDQFEITKKFSDTLSLGLRREARHNNPDERIADYSLLRLQLGLDF
ncbi:hypothetical protein ASA1KI_01850 [Opitutales bacterium ASA1]|uniref:DUF481 domain-containing protein n=1 Tax=Congregicoccus parvus TaxID=3081749 RepID=UPI002B29BF02|nr:hypothetical protein ASA1KI_01850 [Opitutales bacterium ASA1]